MANDLAKNYVRWLFFVTLSVFLVTDIFFIGLIFKLLSNEFILFTGAISSVLTAIIIRYMPGIDMLKVFIFESRWRYYLIPLVLAIIVFAITVSYIWIIIIN